MGPPSPLAYLRLMAVLALAYAFLCCLGLRVASAAAVLATLAALLGVGALVVIMAAMDGFRADLSKKMPRTTPILPSNPAAARRLRTPVPSSAPP